MTILKNTQYVKVRSIAKIINNKTVLITGATGSFGKKMVETLIKNYKLIVVVTLKYS